MGWYTDGPGGLEYKYGDVVALAKACRIGRLAVMPRVLPADEFLSDVQAEVEAAGRPWRHLDFGAVDGPSEALAVPFDVDPARVLADIVAHVVEFADSIDPDATELLVGLDWTWSVPADEIPALLGWLGEPFTVEALRAGTLDDGEYVPPPALAETFDRLDDARHLAASALGGALVEDDDVYLDQPDDEYQEVAVRRDR